MKTKAVVFKVHSQQVVPGKREDEPQRWFHDRGILLIQISSSITPDVLVIDQALEHHELLHFFEIAMFDHADVLVVSDDEEFIRWAKERGLHTITTHNIDDIINHVLTVEYKKEL